MPKTTYILAFMLFAMLGYGQQITFQENVNYRASALEQSLNDAGDALLLESQNGKILHVEIFNYNFTESIDINSNKAKIDLKTLPAGNFVIQARLETKWIIMSLQKYEDANKPTTLVSIKKENNIDLKKSIQKNIVEEMQMAESPYYWVVSESNANFGSNKSMRLEYREDVPELVSKIELELKSKVGKNNKLLVYEVYNKSQFMTKQLRNPLYYTSEESEYFNVVPIYALVND